ncbi:MazG-like protein [Flavobacterium johnsoniae]|uniref:MazG-like protein n=1 Tax=Flavobacterium johnsoniae TaxID=986 RepID=UPI0025AF0259|nr:MazG-like protein [Flavobacterium johnsoniae]WJS96682.1 MazG-like protein [Flavobacterium johnsoniae]
MSTTFDEIIERSLEIRKKYHELELHHHGSKWSVEEDALAYLTDAGLIGRNVMSQQERWPKLDSESELKHKLGENIWWLIVIAERSGIDIKKAMNSFLEKTETLLE